MSNGFSRRSVLRGMAASTIGAGGAAAIGESPAPAAPAEAAGHDGRGIHLDNRLRTDEQWARFLGEQDPVWARMPKTWYEGPFLGNGFLGSIIYQEPGANAIRFTIQHSEVQDHRPQIGGNDWGVARVPVGHVSLEPVGQITGVEFRLHLWDAEVTGTVTTDKGTIRLRGMIHNDRSMLLVTARASAGERTFRWVFHPAKALSPRASARRADTQPRPGDVHRGWRHAGDPADARRRRDRDGIPGNRRPHPVPGRCALVPADRRDREDGRHDKARDQSRRAAQR
jgi:alpha-L-fucosidase 2